MPAQKRMLDTLGVLRPAMAATLARITGSAHRYPAGVCYGRSDYSRSGRATALADLLVEWCG